MPVEYVRDSNGRVVVKGSLGSGQAVVPEKPPAPKPKPKPASKPKAKPQGFQVFGFGPQGFSLNKLANDLAYEVKSGRAAQAIAPVVPVAPLIKPAALGAITATTNAGRNVVEMKQKAGGRRKADYTTSPVGRVLDKLEGQVFTALGEKDPAQMTPQEKNIRDLRGSLTLAVGTGLATGPALGALSGVRFIGPAAQALRGFIDPSTATTVAGALTRVAGEAIVGEITTTPFDDNTGGSAAGLVDMVLGTKLDPVKPGMDRVEAASAAFLPNLAAGGVLGGALVGASRLIDSFSGTTRARNAQRTIEPIQSARADLEGAGLTQVSPETEAAAFTPDAMDPKSPLAQANAELEAKYGIAPAEPKAEPEPAPAPTPAVDGEPAPVASSVDLDQWEVDYDPSLPEADVALSLIRNSSDAELLESIRSGGSVLEVLDEQMAARAPVGPDPTLSMELNAAPTERLAEPITPFVDQWKRLGQKDPQQFLATFHPDVNPDLAARAKAMFGRDWEQLTVDDGVAVLQAAADDGTTVIPNRLLPGQQIMKVPDIKVDPQRFQYKGGVDARGVQRGSSLEGVDRWNTDMENVVEVWQDPADGAYYVVNGHNRLAKAKELGINTLVVKEIIADTAEQAKTAGALSNIASGGGKPIDAARFMKGVGVKDPAQLEAMGVPLSPDSGHGLSGFQLSQLPEDVLQAVESGQIKERMGRIIGASGADEESMRAAYRYLVENPGTTEGRMKGMLELSKQMTAPKGATKTEQTDLLKGTDWDQTFNQQMIAVADLADEVSTLLKREKKLFTMADTNSAALEAKGSRIDKASAQQVADANARAIDFFQRTWMETGPIRDLLNEGGARVAAGENKAAVAKQIKNRLVGQLGDLMGEEAVARTDVVQEDLLAQAQPQQLDELLPEDRPAMEMLAIQRAIQNGEVRPPETPIPELPTDSGVDLIKAQRDIEANTITDDVVRAMDDELALREQFSELDDAVARETEKAARDQMGYDLMTFEEKKAAGLVDVVEELARPSSPQFTFPADLAKSAPRYGMAKVEFASDFDRAAYMLRDATKKSKGEDRLVAALEQTGFNVADVRAHGEKVKQALKQVAIDQTGSARAPQSATTLTVPDQGPIRSGSQILASRPRPSFNSSSPQSRRLALDNYDIWGMNPDFGGSDGLWDVLLEYNSLDPGYLRNYLAKVGDLRADGVWTLGKLGAKNIIEKDIVEFMGRMSGGRADIADAVFAEMDGKGYGRIEDQRPGRVGGIAYDDVNQTFADYLLISRHGAFMQKEGPAELAMLASHEALHRLQMRFMTSAQIDQLLTPEAKRYFLYEAEKGYGTEARRMEPVELQAWGSQRVVAARLLFAMESAYRKAGLKKAADHVKASRIRTLGEYSAPPTAVSKALQPLVEVFERIKNYLVGKAAGIDVGFVPNKELSYKQLRQMARTARNFANKFELSEGSAIKAAIDDLLVVEPPIPDSVRKVLDAAYTGMIAQQPMRGPHGFRVNAESWIADQRKLGMDYGFNLARLSELVGETGGKPFGRKDFSEEAVAAFEAGNPGKMVNEASSMVTKHLDDINARIEAVKQRAAQEGC